MAQATAAPMQFKFETAFNPSGWSFLNLSPDGITFTHRLTRDMVTFDLDRADIKVNVFGVVLFYDRGTARHLLSSPGNTTRALTEIGIDNTSTNHASLTPSVRTRNTKAVP